MFVTGAPAWPAERGVADLENAVKGDEVLEIRGNYVDARSDWHLSLKAPHDEPVAEKSVA